MPVKLLTTCDGVNVFADEDGYVNVDEHGNAMLAMLASSMRLVATVDYFVLVTEDNYALVDQNDNALVSNELKKMLIYNSED